MSEIVISASQADRIINELRWVRLRHVDDQLASALASKDLTQAQIEDLVIQARIAWDTSYPALAELRVKTLRGRS